MAEICAFGHQQRAPAGVRTRRFPPPREKQHKLKLLVDVPLKPPAPMTTPRFSRKPWRVPMPRKSPALDAQTSPRSSACTSTSQSATSPWSSAPLINHARLTAKLSQMSAIASLPPIPSIDLDWTRNPRTSDAERQLDETHGQLSSPRAVAGDSDANARYISDFGPSDSQNIIGDTYKGHSQVCTTEEEKTSTSATDASTAHN